MDTIHTIGRRKTAVARIYMSKGKGNIIVNNREAKDYFTTGTLMYKLTQPFGLVDAEGQYDVRVNVSGGGITRSSRSSSFSNCSCALQSKR